MSSLFEAAEREHLDSVRPLADRMRPTRLEHFVGQKHFLSPGSVMDRVLRSGRFTSLVFYGAPGTGKTTLAHLVAGAVDAEFVRLNAAGCGVKELRESLQAARDRLQTSGLRTVLFVDELHHFNRTQQDVLLPDVESGVVALIGATTSNPFFALNAALVSRSHVFEFRPITSDDLIPVFKRAIDDKQLGYGRRQLTVDADALQFLADVSDGDVRKALSSLELAVESLELGETLTRDLAAAAVQKKALLYDSSGDQHYDVISAYIKSLRGADPDAAIYWLARMLESGEDPRFVARRLLIAASEDVGNADPQALVIAEAAAAATERLGMPECRIPLAQATTYVALAPKSNASYVAINAAIDDVRSGRILNVPPHLRDKHSPGVQAMGDEANYLYPHDYDGGWVAQNYLPEERTYYRPSGRGREADHARRLEEIRRNRK